MKEALSSSETSVLTSATRHNIPEDAILRSLACSQEPALLTLWHSSYCEMDSCSASQENFPLIWILTVYYLVHRISSLLLPGRVLVEELTAAQLVRKFIVFLWIMKVRYRFHRTPPKLCCKQAVSVYKALSIGCIENPLWLVKTASVV
jgi:hypothetical protein